MAERQASMTGGLRANWRQFALLLLINAFVGAMIGLERTVLPLMAEDDFGLVSKAAIFSFLISFGLVKALANYFAGRLSDRVGRKPILLAGWLVGLPVPLLIILAPTWGWIVFANVLLGANQGLCWSTTVIMKIDLAGQKRRGLAMGLNESAGYVAVSLSALMTGYLAAAYGLRPVPFYPGIGFALAGLLLTLFFVRETLPLAQAEAQQQAAIAPDQMKGQQALASGRRRALLSANQAGLANNLNDGMMWGLAPIFLLGAGLTLGQVAIVTAAYPWVWGLGQLGTGALSDRWGRKWMIVAGMWTQAAAIGLFAASRTFWLWTGAAILLGAGTALVYPTLLAAVSDVAQADRRATAVGKYRLWRDLGFAAGALVAGVVADALGFRVAIAVVGALTLLSGVVVALAMAETLVRDKGTLN